MMSIVLNGSAKLKYNKMYLCAGVCVCMPKECLYTGTQKEMS